MMSFVKTVCSSFANNETLAFCSSDGVLHVWNANTGEQMQQYLPSSHLDTAMFTCLSWKAKVPIQKKTASKTKKNSRLPAALSEEKAEYIALGTAGGEIVLYNHLNGEVVMKFSGGHNERVNGISWGNEGMFYTCSNDQHLVEWNVKSPNYKCKWKAKKREIYSVCVGPYGKTLLSAGKIIELWDLKTKELLKKFVGHSSPVFFLSSLNMPSLAWQGTTTIEGVDGLYFLSAASEDRSVSAWQIKSAKHKKTAICSFSLPSEPCFLDVSPSQSAEKPAKLLVITEDEQIVIFSHTLNGHSSKSLIVNPTQRIKIVTDDAVPLKIICATFDRTTNGQSSVVIIAYGLPARVAFERVNLSDFSEPDIVLIRKDPSKIEIYLEQDKMKLREPSKKVKATSIVPGVLGHAGEKSSKRRRRRSTLGETELTMDERIKALSVDAAPPTRNPPRADSLSILLSQGLQSNDRDILNQVLQHANETLIRNTVRQIPINYVIPLVKEVTERLQGGPEKCLIFIKWMKATLSCHSSFLLTYPDIVPLLNRLYQLMTIRTQTHSRLSRLEGKLELILNQVSANQSKSEGTEQAEALYVFEEDSSDEHDDMDVVAGEMSDSAEDWNEFSDEEKSKNRRNSDGMSSDDNVDEDG